MKHCKWRISRIILPIILIYGCNNSRMDRPQDASDNKLEVINNLLTEKQIELGSVQLYLRAFKKEQRLEIFAKNKNEPTYQFVVAYPFCTSSGHLGPKRKEGDRQIPEGIYHIDRFNPNSKFHLSLGLNYPNASDIILADKNNPGSDIFIHGGCESVGCISITNDKIEEVYLLASYAKRNQSKIRVDIYPFDYKENWKVDISEHKEHHKLWTQLYKIYNDFENDKKLTDITISKSGKYDIAKSN